MRQLIDIEGRLLGEPPCDLAETRRLYAAMLTARLYDRKATALQKQGRLATYAPLEGQEAAQIGAAAALQGDDWMVATYRDAAAMWFHGYTWPRLLLTRIGDERGGSPPEGVMVLPPSITVGAHMLHAVGLGWATRKQGRVAMTFFGDGATSEGDFHEAMNLAGVWKAPVVFVCENNQYAISLPRERQTASATIAQKADAYGMPGEMVDGNDLLAMRAAAADAVKRARGGEGPTLIEALTYRIQPHTTTDDPGRYRSPEEAAEWRARDPLERVRRYLTASGVWTAQDQAQLEAAASADIEAAVTEAEALAPLGPAAIFNGMFATPTPALVAQAATLARDLGRSIDLGER